MVSRLTQRAQMKWEVKSGMEAEGGSGQTGEKNQQHLSSTFACCAKALTGVV
jgi:hypothetical protein